GAGFLSFVVGVVLAVIFIIVTFRFNLAKIVIVVGTAVAGAGIIVAAFLLGADKIPLQRLAENPIREMLQGNFLWTVVFILLVIAGIVVQLGVNRSYELEPYENRI